MNVYAERLFGRKGSILIMRGWTLLIRAVRDCIGLLGISCCLGKVFFNYKGRNAMPPSRFRSQ